MPAAAAATGRAGLGRDGGQQIGNRCGPDRLDVFGIERVDRSDIDIDLAGDAVSTNNDRTFDIVDSILRNGRNSQN
ncbi:MAG: hypothetical protein B7X57_06520 [Erythrobacter sp. 34-65-8]|nr:MAG: hypothetical protein B7X57_06520 [Erythrobacter sp. 34-65-8]